MTVMKNNSKNQIFVIAVQERWLNYAMVPYDDAGFQSGLTRGTKFRILLFNQKYMKQLSSSLK